MKTCWLSIVLFIVFPTFGYASDDETQSIDSSVREVTVFRNGAQITRQATVALAPGRNEILFTGLSPSLDARTIQLTGSGTFMILSLSHRQDYLQVHPQKERLQQLTARRDSLQHRIEEKEAAQSILDRELSILLSNTTLKGEQQNLSTSDLQQAMDYFHQKLTDLEMQKLRYKREIEHLQEERQKIQNQISELNNSSSQNSSVITAVLQSESATRVQLTLSYMVSGAGWYPSYDLRVRDIDSPVNLAYKANVHQSTGVDWEDVILTVTSAIPDQGGVLPQLQPWYLRFYTPQLQRRSMDTGRAMERPSEAAQPIISGQQQENLIQTVPVREIQNQTSFSYQIDLPYSVPSGGKPLAVGINNAEISAEYRYQTIPKLRNQAYLTAKIGEWDQYNLLPGDANLFFENTYVGKSAINPRSVGDTLSFSLGKDESVVIEREKLREFEEKNFFGTRIRESFTWEISVRNSKNKPVNIGVEDQIPVPQHEDIKVNLTEASDAEYNRQNGMLNWLLYLDPGETKTLRFAYEVEYPRGRQVTF